MTWVQKPFVESLGILASYDPVAIDQASIDLIEKETGKKLMSQLILILTTHLNFCMQKK